VSWATKTFGMLTILSSPKPDVYRCRCKCGNTIELWRSQLGNDVVRHCGCRDSERQRGSAYYRHVRCIRRTNGTRRRVASAEYYSYSNMIARCYVENSRGEPAYEQWGGKGIRVCDRWLEPNGQGFKNFLFDMGPRPSGKTLDRKNPQDHYHPLNCAWGDAKEQAWHQTRFMWKNETPPPVPPIVEVNEWIDAEFASAPY
jgi:hypothetical protein